MNNSNQSGQIIRAFIFDLGGVILRTDDPEPRRLLAARYGKTYSELDAIVFGNPVSRLAEQGQATPEQVWTEIGITLRIPNLEIAKFREEFFAGDCVDQELIHIISSLHELYQTAMLSNTWVKDLDRYIQDDLNIPPIFNHIISSAHYGETKPGAAIFIITLDALGIQANEALFVDDNAENISAASQLGLHTIRFMNKDQFIQDLHAWVQIPDSKK